MHGSHDTHDMKMMWLMMVACALPIVLISLGSGALKGRNALLLVLGVAIFAVVHMIMMRHGRTKKEE